MQSSPSELVKRLGLAVIGQALPKTSALSEIIRDVRRGLLATVITGVLVSSFVLLGCLGFYQFLIAEGLSSHATIGLSAGLLLLLTIISGLVAEKYISKASQAKEKLTPFASEETGVETSIESLFQAFVDGLIDGGHSEKSDNARKQSMNGQAHGTPAHTESYAAEQVDSVRH